MIKKKKISICLTVIAGLIFPPVILRLEFKSKQELQLMPQTEEEHLIDLKVPSQITFYS